MKTLLTALLMFALTITSSHCAPHKHFSVPAGGRLTPEMISFYNDNGFLIIRDYLSSQQASELRQQAHSLVSQFEPDEEALSVFTTVGDRSQKDRYFMESADKVRFFLEEGAVKDGKLTLSKDLAINKIGHALHDQDPVFKRATFTKMTANIATDIGISNPEVAQSMYIFKSPGVGGTVTPHQDATFLYTDPISVTGFWMALEDADPTNSCMYAIPGSHKWPLNQRFTQGAESMKFSDLADHEWPDDQYISLAVPTGTLIILHGKLVHKSKKNTSDRSRNAYTFHVISGDTKYAEDNWLQRKEGFPKLIG